MLRLRTNLDVWRTTLFVSLGLAASACGARAFKGDDTDGDVTGDSAIPKNLRCENDRQRAEAPEQSVCDNAIVHRTRACSECAPPSSSVVADTCTEDSDCAPRGLCIASLMVRPPSNSCVSPFRERYFSCQNPDDECGADRQCGERRVCAQESAEGQRRCTAEPVGVASPCPEPTPGRPFLVAGEARVAAVYASLDWCSPRQEAQLDPVAADHWLRAALMEHASIAAFARFTLQLMQLGAPLELIVAGQEAMRDETEHARRCFALAARYAGRALGPGPLPLHGAWREQALEEIVRLAFIEGCIGETVAAVEASEALALASDSEESETLAIIARDEKRHAELAWRFVAWALAQEAGGQVRAALSEEIAAARAEGARGLRGEVMARVVIPCAERLLAPRGDAERRAAEASAPA